MQSEIDSAKNPADMMDYPQLLQVVERNNLEIPSRKKVDVYAVVKRFYDEK